MTEYYTHPRITKMDVPAWEYTPFALGDTMFRAAFRRAWSATQGHGILIEQYDDFRECWFRVGVLPTTRYLGCVLPTSDGRLIVFTTTDTSQTQNQVMACEVDPVTWSWLDSEWLAYTAPAGHKVYNSSACTYPGGYVLAVETTEGSQPFSMRAIKSPDLLSWTPFGTLCNESFYFACPTIRYIEDGWFLVLGLWKNRDPADPTNNAKITYETGVFHTNDFVTVDAFHGNATLPAHNAGFSPDPGEGRNNSDVDLCEHRGKVYFTYLTGDQTTWAFNNMAVFDGTLVDFYRTMWPKA